MQNAQPVIQNPQPLITVYDDFGRPRQITLQEFIAQSEEELIALMMMAETDPVQ